MTQCVMVYSSFSGFYRKPTLPKMGTEPEMVGDAGSAHVEPQREELPPAASQRVEEQDELRDRDQRIERLMAENRALREAITKGKYPAPSVASTPPPVPMPRSLARRTLDDEGITVQDFLRLRTPEFKGEEGEDPQRFLEETEKMVRRLPCSDARAIELVGLTLKGDAWDWYQRHVEERLYTENPPIWEEFRQAMMDEFLSPSERQNRALQFERLKQLSGMSVAEYAREFTRLGKYAPYIIPTEAARIERFKSGLIAPLYNTVLTAEFPTLSKLIDKAKQWETRSKEERAEKELRRKSSGGGQGSRDGPKGIGPSVGQAG